MADFDAKAYKYVDLTDIQSLIKGGDQTYPMRSAASRLLNRAEDISYLIEGCKRREAMALVKGGGVVLQKYKLEPSPKRGDLYRAAVALQQCLRDPFTTREMYSYSSIGYLANCPHGFALKPNWYSLFPSQTEDFTSATQIIDKIKSAIVTDSRFNYHYDEPIVKQSVIHEIYEKMTAASAIFVPFGNNFEVFSPHPNIPQKVVLSSSSFQRDNHIYMRSGQIVNDQTVTYVSSISRPWLKVFPNYPNGGDEVFIYNQRYGSSYMSFRDVDGNSTSYASGSDRFVYLLIANGYGGTNLNCSTMRLIMSHEFGGSINQILYDTGLYRIFDFPQNPTPESFYNMYTGRPASRGIEISAFCIGRVYADPTSIKKWMWPGLT